MHMVRAGKYDFWFGKSVRVSFCRMRAPCNGLSLTALLFLDQIKREKGVWWMPWQQEAMKDVILCDKLWGAENRL